MAQFARAAGVPILPVIVTRHGWRRLRFQLFAPVVSNPALDKAADLRNMTASVLNTIETAIRQAPEQWFWYNRRWLLEPVEPR